MNPQTANNLWKSILTLHFDLRTWHWRTKSYAQHVAFGEAYNALSPLLDSLAESSIAYQVVFDVSFDLSSTNQAFLSIQDNKPFLLMEIKSSIDLFNEYEFGFKDLDNIKDEIQQVLSLLYYKISELS